MNTQILKLCYLFYILNFTLCIPSIAQIVYTDVMPDQSFNVNNSLYHLDLNNDSITDYEITLLTASGVYPQAYIRLDASAGNSVSVSSSLASALNYSELISSANLWWTASYYNIAKDGWVVNGHTGQLMHVIIGNWCNATDKYLALKFIFGGGTYYGWARLDAHVNSNGTGNFTIKDYAYNAAANQSILAGDSGTGLTQIIYNIPDADFFVYPNPAANFFIISLPITAKNVEVSFVDINGKIIFTTIAAETRKIEVNTRDFAEGIYYVQIKSAEFFETRKLIVTK